MTVQPQKQREIIGYEEIDMDGWKCKVPIYKPLSSEELDENYSRIEKRREELRERNICGGLTASGEE